MTRKQNIVSATILATLVVALWLVSSGLRFPFALIGLAFLGWAVISFKVPVRDNAGQRISPAPWMCLPAFALCVLFYAIPR